MANLTAVEKIKREINHLEDLLAELGDVSPYDDSGKYTHAQTVDARLDMLLRVLGWIEEEKVN